MFVTSQERRALTGGLSFWLLFCVAAVCVRGARWEETFECVQVLLGRIPYPEGHPFYQFVHRAFALQFYLSAALFRLIPSPSILCGFRDALFLHAVRKENGAEAVQVNN